MVRVVSQHGKICGTSGKRKVRDRQMGRDGVDGKK